MTNDWVLVQTSCTPHLDAIICAVSKARCKSEEYIAEIFGSLDSLSATYVVRFVGIIN